MSIPSETPAQPVPPPRPGGSRRTRLIVLAAVLAVLLLAALVVVADWVRGGAGTGTGDRVVSGPLDGRERASLAVLGGVTTLRLSAGDLGDRLYRAETPPDGSRLPRASVTGDDVRLEVVDSGRPGASRVDIQVSSAVQWRIRVLSGAAEQVVDLSAGRVTEVDLAGGATRIELSLPRAAGTTAVRMSGGVGQFAVHLPADVPVRVRVGGGAASVTIDGQRTSGLSAGKVLAAPAWDAATDRVDVDAAAGMSDLVVDRR